jgi:hypothetical protein
MYYNEEAKAEFIKDYMRSRIVAATSLSGIFNKTEHFENELGKDCSQFTKNEILNMYKQFGAKSVNVLGNYNVYLKSYTGLMLYKNKINNVNAYESITKDDLKQCIDLDVLKQIYITREQLNDIENELLNYSDKAIVEALWHGISGKSMSDLTSLNEKMFIDNKKALCFPDGRIVQISQRLSEYLQKAFHETDYMCYGSSLRVDRMVGEGNLYKERANAHAGDSDDVRFRWVYRRIQNYRKHLDIPILTMKTIQASGLLHELQKGMQQHDCSMREFLSTEKGRELAVQYGYKLDYYVDVISDKYNQLQG